MKWIFERLLPLFITRDNSQASRRVFWILVILLFLSGTLMWAKFLNWGRGPYEYHDWKDITIPRITFVRDAVQMGVLPLHIRDSYPFGGITDRYQTIPDAFLSPQIFLLRWLDIGPFLVINLLLLYAVGFAGLVRLCRKKNLSPLSLTILFLLFNFNGHMLAHISVGHYTWTASFLFPWLILMVLELFDGQGGWPWVLKVSVLLLVMLLQGGYHQVIWSLILLALLILAIPQQFSTLARALVSSILVGAVRFLPPFLELGKFDNRFVAGYPMFQTIWASLLTLHTPNDYTLNQGMTEMIGWWEYTFYIGLIAAVFLVGFGVFSTILNRQKPGSYAALLVPVTGLIVLSIDVVYHYLRTYLPLPLFTGERVASRMIFLAFCLLLVLAVIEFQHWIDRQNPSSMLAIIFLGAIGIVANDLRLNFHIWQVSNAAKSYNLVNLSPSLWEPIARTDLPYTNLLFAGAVISVASLIALIVLSARSKQHVSQGSRAGEPDSNILIT